MWFSAIQMDWLIDWWIDIQNMVSVLRQITWELKVCLFFFGLRVFALQCPAQVFNTSCEACKDLWCWRSCLVSLSGAPAGYRAAPLKQRDGRFHATFKVSSCWLTTFTTRSPRPSSRQPWALLGYHMFLMYAYSAYRRRGLAGNGLKQIWGSCSSNEPIIGTIPDSNTH